MQPLAMPVPLILRQLQLGPMQNFVYLIGDGETREAAVVDAGWDVEAILKAAEQDELTITKVLLSHNHFDHVNAVGPLLEKVSAPVYIHQDDVSKLQGQGFDSYIKPIGTEDDIMIGRTPVRFLHTPGHTPGSITFQVHNAIVTGDTLFVGACGRFDLGGGDAAIMYDSLMRPGRLDGETLVFPGHDYGDSPTTTIARENATNPYLRFGSLSEFLYGVGAR
jgi:glyoxylase-like metal-dependent hydrolase (beta-lactamase superfamily II)